MEKNFKKTGLLDFGVILNQKKCKILKKRIQNLRAYKKSIFYNSYEEFLKYGRIAKTSPGLSSHNIIYEKNINLDFIDNSEKFKKSVSSLMGSNYKIIKRSVIMHIPSKLLPKWVQNKTKNIGRSNLNPWIKDKFQDVQYFSCLDFHQDMNKPISGFDKYATFSINLDKVGKKDGPIQILENTQVLGRTFYPHFVRQSAHDKNIWFYSDLKGNHIKSRNRVITGPAGKVFCFHGLSLHGTFYNESSKPRISLRYLISSSKNQFKKTKWGNSFKTVKGKIKIKNDAFTRLDVNKDGSYRETGISIKRPN